MANGFAMSTCGTVPTAGHRAPVRELGGIEATIPGDKTVNLSGLHPDASVSEPGTGFLGEFESA
jgi:hypothetical protein